MELTDEQRALRQTVRALLSRPPRPARPGRGGPDDERAWQRLCTEVGVAGLAIPERYGGAGAGPVETHVVAEELGRTLTTAPLLGSAVLAAQAIIATGDGPACGRLLPAIAGGTAIAALAWTTGAGRWDPTEVAFRAAPAGAGAAGAARPAGAEGTEGAGEADWVLDGTAHYVLHGDRADVLVIAARTAPGIGLFEVDPHTPGVTRTAVTSMDPASPLAVVELAGAAGRRIGGCGPTALARARDLACIALSAEQVGAAQRALDLTVGYTTTRVQFGRAIGGFQALQHRMADLHVLVESARSLSYGAAEAAASGAPDLGLRAAAAKVYCSEALARVAAEMIQLHGAIGITWEYDAHRFLKRAHSTAQLLGQPGEHLARMAAELIDR
jgi:alkylation response protein AidB-like acyl-CoA dehydrogenase